MEKTPFELLVREALVKTAAREWALVPGDLTPVYSIRYRTWEKKLLSAPFRYARRHARPMWKKAMQAAACVLLTVSLAFGGVMAASPSARAWVAQILAEWLGDHARFSFSGRAGRESGTWRTGYLPEGFELVSERQMTDLTTATYENTDNVKLQLIYAQIDSANFSVDSEHQTREELIVHGNSGYLLRSNRPDKPSYLVWVDEAHGTAFQLKSTISVDELIKVAEGITLH